MSLLIYNIEGVENPRRLNRDRVHMRLDNSLVIVDIFIMLEIKNI